MVKGLARLRNCSRHDLWVKYVDVSPFVEMKGGYSPMTVRSVKGNLSCVYRTAQ